VGSDAYQLSDTNMPLTDTAIRNAKPSEKPRKLSDGGGLFLLVQPAGSKLWRQAYRFDGKQKLLSHGIYPAVTLQEARSKRDAAKTLLARGIDPGQARQEEKAATKLREANTFENLAREWFNVRRDGWTVGYADRMLRRLEADVFPQLGARPINEMEPPDLLKAIRAVEARGAVVLAGRLLQVCGQIFRFAVASGRAVRDPSQDLRGALRSPGAKKHRAALKPGELGSFLRALASYPGDQQTALALQFVLHTMVRTAEARFAKWEEFELAGSQPIWRIPAERMKMRASHLVPLTPQVVGILGELRKLAGDSDYMLPSATKDGVISQNTLIYAVYRLGYHSRATVHGFRGTASTVLNEHGFNRDWIERQLAHTDRDGIRAAYNSAEWLSDRRAMLAWWSNYLDAAKSVTDASG
jgi:integrase